MLAVELCIAGSGFCRFPLCETGSNALLPDTPERPGCLDAPLKLREAT